MLQRTSVASVAAPDDRQDLIDKTGRGWLPWSFVGATIVAGIYTTLYFDFACFSENQSQEVVEFCETELGWLGIGGAVVAYVSAFVARGKRREWPWLCGVVLALAMSGLVWLLAP